MKKLFIAVLLVLAWAGSAWGAPGLQPVDYFPYVFYGVPASGDSNATNSDYIYGFDADHYMMKMDVSGNITECSDSAHQIRDGLAPNGNNYSIYSSIDSGLDIAGKGDLVFCIAKDSASHYYLLKSVDGFANYGNNSPNYDNMGFSYVFGREEKTILDGDHITTDTVIDVIDASAFENGDLIVIDLDDGTTHCTTVDGAPVGNAVTLTVGLPSDAASGNKVYEQNAGVRILESRGFCVADINGITTLLLGSYVDDIGEDVWLMKSIDQGDTWTKVLVLNQGGNHVTHIHTIRQDPYTGNVWIAVGDADVESAIIIAGEDKIENSDFTDNSTVDFSAWSGKQRYRVTDFLFDLSYVYVYSDANALDMAENGIWRGDKSNVADNETSYARVNSYTADQDVNHTGSYGVKTGDGKYLFVERINGTGSTVHQLALLASQNPSSWELIGYWGIDTDHTGTVRDIFEWNDYIWISSRYGAGKSSFATSKSEWNGTFDEPVPIIQHPVYWITPTGAGAKDGLRPSTAEDTIEDLLEGNNICLGAMVDIGAGTYTENQITTQWDSAATQGTGNVVVRGAGKNNTIITHNGDIGQLIYNADENEGILILRDLTMKGPSTETSVLRMATGGICHTYDCIIGDRSLYPQSVVMIDGAVGDVSYFKGVRTEIRGYPSGTGGEDKIYGIDMNDYSNVQLEMCLIDGFRLGIYADAANSPLSILNTSIVNFGHSSLSSAGLYISGLFDQKPTIKNTIISSKNSTADYSYYDLAGISEDSNIDNSCFDNSVSGLTGYGINMLFLGPRLLDTDNNDYHLSHYTDYRIRRGGLSISGVTESDIDGNRINQGSVPMGPYKAVFSRRGERGRR